MKVQATSFRLPALNLVPRESKVSLSQELFDYNQSSSSIVYKKSPLKQDNVSPIKRRHRGLTIAVYNSQEKFKTSEFKNSSNNPEFITQTQNAQNTSIINTVRRYKSKLKQMMYNHNSSRNEEMARQRDPRIYSFKECSTATIRLTKLNEIDKPPVHELKNRVQELMSKVQMLISTQTFYKVQEQQDSFQVSLVKLRDEYSCLSQDFNDFYESNKKMDSQVLSLINHLEILKKLLLLRRHKPTMSLSKEPSKSNFQDIQEPELVTISELKSVTEHSNPQPITLPSMSNVSEVVEQVIATPLTSSVIQNDPDLSDFSDELESPDGSKKKQKIKIRLKTQKVIQPENTQSEDPSTRRNKTYQEIEQEQTNITEQVVVNKRPKKIIVQEILNNIRQPENQIIDNNIQEKVEEEDVTKPTNLKRGSNNNNATKKKSVIYQKSDLKIENKKKNHNANAIDEDGNEISSDEQSSLQSIDTLTQRNETPAQVQIYDFGILDKLSQMTNIYDFQLFQNWGYHFEMILKGDQIGEFDM